MTFEGCTLQNNISGHVPGNQSRQAAYGCQVKITLLRRQLGTGTQHICDYYGEATSFLSLTFKWSLIRNMDLKGRPFKCLVVVIPQDAMHF